MPFWRGFELPGLWGIFEEAIAPGVLLDFMLGVRAWLDAWIISSLPYMAPVARIGPPALNPTPLLDLSGLKAMPILREWGPLDCPVVGAPKLGFTLFDPMRLICSGPPEGVAVFLAMAAPKLVEMPPRFEDLPSFKVMDFWLLPLVEACPEFKPLGY